LRDISLGFQMGYLKTSFPELYILLTGQNDEKRYKEFNDFFSEIIFDRKVINDKIYTIANLKDQVDLY
jgi:hypothetical protein